MKNHPITNTKFHPGGIITYTMINTWFPSIVTCGWGNAYICLPQGHKYYGLDYDDIPGIKDQEWTYSQEEIISNEQGEEAKYWVFGFDTAHYGQDKYNWNESRVVEVIEGCVPMFL